MYPNTLQENTIKGSTIGGTLGRAEGGFAGQQTTPVTPIVDKLITLHDQINIAHDALSSLSTRLAGVRSPQVMGQSKECEKRPEYDSAVEEKVAQMIESVAALRARIDNITAELRI